MNSIQHEKFLFDDPAFPLRLHKDELNASRRSVYTNWHTGVELLYGLEGSVRVLLDNEEVSFGVGEMLMIGSNVLHTIHADSERCSYYCLIVSADFLSDHGFSGAHTGFSGVADDPESLKLFERVVVKYKTQSVLRRPAVFAAVLTLFLRLFLNHTQCDSSARQHMEQDYPLMIMEALRFIRLHLLEAICIDDISRHVGMSKYHFCRQFRAYTGMSVLHYINMLRCEYARKLILENGYNVSEAASKLGISNLSYFTRLFKQHTGVLPSKLRSARPQVQEKKEN